MATSATYTLLPLAERTGPVVGAAFPTAGRNQWRIYAPVGRADAPITIVVEVSATGVDGSWSPVLTEVVGAPKVVEASTYDGTLTIQRWHTEIRAQVTVATATYAAQVEASAPFFHAGGIGSDLDLVSQELRDFARGRVRLIEQAEDDVLRLLGRSDVGRLDVVIDRPEFLDQVKLYIARQAEHLLQRHELLRAGKVDELSRLGTYAPGLAVELRAIVRGAGVTIWRGR